MRFNLILASVIIPALTLAAAGNPVQHKHGERSHTHPLPESGVKHTHAVKKQTTPQDKKDAWALAMTRKAINRVNNESLISEGWKPLPNEWYLVGNTQNRLVTFKYDSAKTEGQYETVTLQIYTKVNGEVTISTRIAKVKSSDCKRKMGQVLFFDLGDQIISTLDFVEDGNAAIDSIGASVCEVANNKVF